MPAGTRRIADVTTRLAPFLKFFLDSTFAREGHKPGACLFVTGDPQEGPPNGFVESLQRAAVPRHPNWYGYKNGDPAAQAAIVDTLKRLTGLAYEPDDILLTNGAFAGLATLFLALTDPGDEVIFNSPPW